MGLTNMFSLTEIVPEDDIAAILDEENESQCAYERLVAEANRRGGKDNITAVVTHIKLGES